MAGGTGAMAGNAGSGSVHGESLSANTAVVGEASSGLAGNATVAGTVVGEASETGEVAGGADTGGSHGGAGWASADVGAKGC